MMFQKMQLLSSAVALALTVAWASAAEPAFSALPDVDQASIRKMVEAPPPQQRTGPYSTPMYYLMREGFEYRGDYDRNPKSRPHPNMVNLPLTPDYGSWKLDKNRPDWQEVMIKDWVDLGLNSVHFNIYPDNTSFVLNDNYAKAIKDLIDLSEKNGLKVGVRLDAADWWSMNPNNPNNLIDSYIEKWIKKVIPLTKGKVQYYVLGDELVWKANPPYYVIPPEQEWTAELYLSYFKKVSAAIKKIDPEAKVSMYATSVAYYDHVRELLKIGYADYGDGIAVNSSDIGETAKLFAEVRKRSPKMMLLSNGVGYLATSKAQPQYPVGTPYDQIATDEAHGAALVKIMYTWWQADATAAPYYLSVRNWVKEGKVYPNWYGLFGFEDYVIKDDKMSVVHYPDAMALKTLAHTFYDRSKFKTPGFDVTSSVKLTNCNAYTHQVKGGTELVLMLWNNGSTVNTTIDIATKSFRYPVKVDLFDQAKWTDVPAEVTDKGLRLQADVGDEPTIIRLVRRN